jgi:succinate dehydrogenase/fumarate reductase flavoprotein subunit
MRFSKGSQTTAMIREEMQSTMQRNAAVYRVEKTL